MALCGVEAQGAGLLKKSDLKCLIKSKDYKALVKDEYASYRRPTAYLQKS